MSTHASSRIGLLSSLTLLFLTSAAARGSSALPHSSQQILERRVPSCRLPWRTLAQRRFGSGGEQAPDCERAMWLADRHDDPRASVVPDRIVLRGGHTHEGHVVAQDETSITLRVRNRDRVYPRERVTEIRTVLDTLPAALAKHHMLSAADATSKLEFAAELRSQNLPLEANLVLWGVLLKHPKNDVAHERLGHTKRARGWFVRDGGRFHSFADLIERRSKWEHAWRFHTTHFDIVSDLDLGPTLAFAWQAERVYASFFELFGEDWKLKHVAEPLVVWLHASRASYRRGEPKLAYFNPCERRIEILAQDLSASAFSRWATRAHDLRLRDIHRPARELSRLRQRQPASVRRGEPRCVRPSRPARERPRTRVLPAAPTCRRAVWTQAHTEPQPRQPNERHGRPLTSGSGLHLAALPSAWRGRWSARCARPLRG